jgi:micrococcal nuclease
MFEYGCKIVKVIDGDTVDVDIDLGFGIWIHKERIRLWGIDTPESRTRDLEEKKYGLLAKQKVEEWLPLDSMQVLITQKDKAGKFGRILGQFKIDDPLLTLNTWMVHNHFAAEYYGQSKEEIEKLHMANRQLIELA